jgi:hypothetical protein
MGLLQLADIVGEPPSDSRGGHGRAHEVRDRAAALAPLEIAVGRRCAAHAGRQHVVVHRQAHRAAGLAPFEARGPEALREPFGSAWSRTAPDPGTTIARTPGATRRSPSTEAASRRSSMRPLVQEPMNTCWTGTPVKRLARL